MKNHRSFSDLLFNIIVYPICILTIGAIIYPLYFIVIASFNNPNEVMNGHVWLLPKGITFKGYETIFEDARIWTGYKVTIIIVSVGTLLSLAVTV